MGRLANEKTLELNISHELLSGSGIGAIGFTQDQESIAGGDVLFPCSIPMILQFKAPKNGRDSLWGKFEVNNNKHKNQHMVLHELAQSGLCRALYIFPLIITDQFLTRNFGHLLDFTCGIDANMITQRHNWNNQSHNVIIEQNYNYQVWSEKSVGKGFPARQLISFLKDSIFNIRYEVPISEYIPSLLRSLIQQLRKLKSEEIRNIPSMLWL